MSVKALVKLQLFNLKVEILGQRTNCGEKGKKQKYFNLWDSDWECFSRNHKVRAQALAASDQIKSKLFNLLTFSWLSKIVKWKHFSRIPISEKKTIFSIGQTEIDATYFPWWLLFFPKMLKTIFCVHNRKCSSLCGWLSAGCELIKMKRNIFVWP